MKKNTRSAIFEPIEIDERFENHRFFQVATLVDRPDCLLDLLELHKKYLNYLLTAKNKVFSLNDLPEKIRDEAGFLPTKYFRPPTLEKAMISAVVFWKISLDDYQPVYFRTENSTKPLDSLTGVNMTMVLDQFTTKSEIEKIFTEKFEKYREEFLKYSPPKLNQKLFVNLKEAKNISNIKRDRKWYWRNENGESYAQIALSELNEEDRVKQLRHDNSLTDVAGVESVKKAIQRYKKLITVDIYEYLT